MKNRFNFILLCFLFVSHESLADPLIRVEGASFKPLSVSGGRYFYSRQQWA